jgi:hypothetical protein
MSDAPQIQIVGGVPPAPASAPSAVPAEQEPTIFSRDYLKKLHTEQKKNHVHNLIAGIIQHVRNASSSGKTSYVVDMTDYSAQHNANHMRPYDRYPPMPVYTPLVIPQAEIVSLFEEKFPGCTIKYEETTVDVSANPMPFYQSPPMAPSSSDPNAAADPNAADPNANANANATVQLVKKEVTIDWS